MAHLDLKMQKVLIEDNKDAKPITLQALNRLTKVQGETAQVVKTRFMSWKQTMAMLEDALDGDLEVVPVGDRTISDVF